MDKQMEPIVPIESIVNISPYVAPLEHARLLAEVERIKVAMAREDSFPERVNIPDPHEAERGIVFRLYA